MIYKDIEICEVRTSFGDACLKLYKITGHTFPDAEKDSLSALYHSHFYYECHILTAGVVNYDIMGETVTLREKELLIIPPYTEHYPFRGQKNAHEIVFALVLDQQEGEAGFFSYFMSALYAQVRKPLLLSDPLMESFLRFDSLVGSKTMRDQCLRKAIAYEIVTSLFEQINGFSTPPEAGTGSDPHKNIDITLEFLINDVRLSLSDIAGMIGYSPRHTARLIQKKYGMGITELRQKHKVDSAKHLLLSGSVLSLQTAALQSGFSSVEAMTHAFRRWENTTPKQFREQNLTDSK